MRPVIPVMLIVLAGCAAPVTPGASQWDWERSQSMLPDFAGQGESFPVLVAHAHAEWSKRMQDEFNENPWVCADIAGNQIPIYGLPTEADAVACQETVDVATGRLFVDPAEFAAWNATAVGVVRGGACYGLVPLSDAEGGFIFTALEHEFRIAWHDDHFTIDGQTLSRGEVLKGTYWVDHGNAEDQRFVRVSFDFPGYWLTSNVQPYPGYEPPAQPPSGSFVDGRLLEVRMADHITSLDQALTPLADAMHGEDPHLTDASIVVVDGRLTELVVGITTSDEAIRWYMASREGGVLRVLGNNSQVHGSGAPFGEAITGHAGRGVGSYGIRDAALIATRFVFAPDKGWASAAGGLGRLAPIPDDACDACIYLYGSSPLRAQGFHYAPEAVPVAVDWAATWQVSHYQKDGSEVVGFFQSAIKES